MGSEGIARPFLTSALDGREWSASPPLQGKSPRYQLHKKLGGWASEHQLAELFNYLKATINASDIYQYDTKQDYYFGHCPSS
jgi:hypothetical protein